MSISEGLKCPVPHEALLLPENHNIGSALFTVNPHSSDRDCPMSLTIVLCLLLQFIFSGPQSNLGHVLHWVAKVSWVSFVLEHSVGFGRTKEHSFKTTLESP